MPFPHPEPGLVVRYSYLWRHEHEAGREEGRKARPCVIVLAVERRGGETTVTVAPVTHRAPHDAHAVEIPPGVKRHLKLDGERSWVMLSEVNQFAWPGYDLQPVSGGGGRYDYGFLPPRLFEKIRAGILNLILARRADITRRD